MSRNLTVELRPKRFSQIAGLTKTKEQLKKTFAERIPTSIIFCGEPGSGKTTLARILALSVQEQGGTFGEPCDDQWMRYDLYHIIERNCAEMSSVESARELLPVLQQAPSFGDWRVLILDEAQQMTPQAQNVLLVPSEDEVTHNIMIYCTTDPGKIIPAIKSRSIIFTLPQLTVAESVELITSTVESVGKKVALERAQKLATALEENAFATGRNVVMAVERMLAGATIAEAVIVQETGSIDFSRLSRALVEGNWNTCREILKLATPADGPAIRLRVAGHLRKVLLDYGAGPRACQLAKIILRLSEPTVYEPGLQLSIVAACIYEGCAIIKKNGLGDN